MKNPTLPGMDNLRWYQIETIEKFIDKLMMINFSELNEVKILRSKLIREVSTNIDFHVDLHHGLEDFHDCDEFESRTKFGQKMIRILDETIRELENEN